MDELGLSAAMEALAKEFSERTNISITITKPALSKLLPDHINTTLYRVVQEALMNIEKHAQATHTSIDLAIIDNWLTLTIKDNGVGMLKANLENPSESGIGTRNLAERVEYHRGKFMLTSTTKGTVVTAKIPRSAFAYHYTQQQTDNSTLETV